MAEPTHEDAQLIVQLAQLNATSGGYAAAQFIWSDAFVPDPDEFRAAYPPSSDESRHVNVVAGWYELIGTLWKNGLLNQELLFDWLAADAVWNRLERILLDQREHSGIAGLWENFQLLAEARVAAV